jgi:hypothetical protein
LDQQQDDTEILLFKVRDVALGMRSGALHAAVQAMLSDLFAPSKVARLARGDAISPPLPLRLSDSVARSIEQMCLQT